MWAAAETEKRFSVTQELDFSDRAKFAPGTHCGLLRVRLPDGQQWRIGDYVTAWPAMRIASQQPYFSAMECGLLVWPLAKDLGPGE